MGEWFEWNARMLPEIDASFTEYYTAKQLADHYGADTVSEKADNP